MDQEFFGERMMRVKEVMILVLWSMTIIVLFIFMVKPVDAKELSSFLPGKCVTVSYDRDALRCATRKHFCIVRYKPDKTIKFSCRKSQAELNALVNHGAD